MLVGRRDMPLDGCRRAGATACAAMFLVASGPVALAHVHVGASAGFAPGFLHPLLGLDHLVAMVAVGLWGAFLGPPAIWALPVVFPLVMAVGGALGIAGLPLPGVEAGIAVSGLVLGLMVAGAVEAPIWLAGLIVGGFALLHGHAHGAELPKGAGALPFVAGFVVATGLLHLAGIALGGLRLWRGGDWIVRGLGLAIAATGAVFLVRHALP